MRKFLALTAIALSAALPLRADADTPKLVTILTSADAQTQLMSMVLTMQALQQGAETHILLCGPAADMALKEAPASATAPQRPKGMSPQGLMQKIMASGGKVDVCAIYLPNKNVDASSLIDGVGAAKPQPMAAELLQENTRIMSF